MNSFFKAWLLAIAFYLPVSLAAANQKALFLTSSGITKPTDLSNVVVWLDGADASVCNSGCVDADRVATWTDKSTNAYSYTQGTAAKKPTFKTNIQNGKSVMRFANASNGQWVSESATTLLSTGAAFDIFYVAKLSSFVNDYMYPFSWKGASAGASPSLGYSTADVAYRQIFWGADTTWMVWHGTTLSSPSGSWHYVEVSYDGTGATTLGHYAANADNAALTLASTSGNNGDTANMVGGFSTGATTHNWEGDIGEYFMYSRVLSASDRAKVVAYLKAKWGL